MKSPFSLLGLCAMALVLSGCLTTPVTEDGNLGAKTVPNTNVNAIISAAQPVFAQSGYTVGPVNYPDSISFDKPAGDFGKLMYGSYGTTNTVRVKLKMIQLGTTNNYQLDTEVYRITNAGEAGFESDKKMSSLWSGQFGPLLKQISAQAANAGPM